jgi:N-dimethylarginine dimethylaminohydrolase
MTLSGTVARFLMCQPMHFAVKYVINPWMNPITWARNERSLAAASRREWQALREMLEDLGATIELMPPVSNVPDLVFTANAAVVLDRTALLARFRHLERRAEEPHFQAAFRALQSHGLIDAIHALPDGLVLEGAGDCVWDPARNLFWMGYGPRTEAAAAEVVSEVFGAKVVPLELADPRFYHLDTALCPLPRGEVMYFPEAFTPSAQGALRAQIAPSQRIEVGSDDACRLTANAVAIGDAVVLSGCSEHLRSDLEARGYRVFATVLGSFLRAGGSAFCLTLRLDGRSSAMRESTNETIAA